MSWQALAWAMKQTAGSATAKAVLLVLADAADETGFTFLGQAEIARRAELTRRAVVAQMARLEAAGLLRRERRTSAGGWRTSDAIELQLKAAPQSEPAAPEPAPKVNETHRGQGEADASLGESDDRPGCAGFTRTVREPPVEPSEPPAAPRAAGRRKPETPLPDGFPTPRLIAEARERAAAAGASLDLAWQAERFRNHARQSDRRCRDWSAAWRNWIAFALSKCPAPPRPAPARPETDPWPARLRGFAKNCYWRTDEWGPKPGRPGCRAPAEALAEALAEHGLAGAA